MMKRSRLCAWTAVVSVGAGVMCAHAAPPCGADGWNLTHEQALFAGTPRVVHAGKDPTAAPEVKTDRLYRLTLTAQQNVTFAAAPGKKALTDGAYAGIVRFKVPSAGTYRVAIDRPFWVDVVQDGKLITSTDFTGERGCEPHKIVAYDVPAGMLLLQVSGQVNPQVSISITRAPPPANSH